MYSLILTDIDGTLLKDDLTISNNTINALAIAREKGIRIVLCSGRYIQGMSFISQELGIKDPIYSAINGSLIKDRGEYLCSNRIDKDSYKIAIKILGSRARSIIAFSESRYAIASDDHWFDLQARICRQEGIRMELSDYDSVTDALQQPIYKILIKDDRIDVVSKLKEELDSTLEGKATIISSSLTNFEVLPLGADKKNTVDILSEHLEIKKKDMIAFGDWDNDAGMLASVGMGIAMGNGSEMAKKSARMVTKDNNHDGISYALHKLGIV